MIEVMEENKFSQILGCCTGNRSAEEKPALEESYGFSSRFGNDTTVPSRGEVKTSITSQT